VPEYSIYSHNFKAMGTFLTPPTVHHSDGRCCRSYVINICSLPDAPFMSSHFLPYPLLSVTFRADTQYLNNIPALLIVFGRF